MKPLSKLHQEAILKAKTEQEKITAAATAMIETPMDLIRAILLKHEQAVIEVMSDLTKERNRARELLERCENEMRHAGWNKFESDNTARNGVYEQVKEFLK
jgi:hypothetical protein